MWFSFRPVLVRTQTKQLGTLPSAKTHNRQNGGPSWQLFGAANESDDLAFIFVAHRRSESYAWQVPHDDASLLAGVGAGGTLFPKNDDTFETLLLMLMQVYDADA